MTFDLDIAIVSCLFLPFLFARTLAVHYGTFNGMARLGKNRQY